MKDFFRGILIGVSDLVPGVSGSTTAHLLGIYKRYVTSIFKLSFLKEYKLFLGVILGIFLGARIISLFIGNVFYAIIISFVLYYLSRNFNEFSIKPFLAGFFLSQIHFLPNFNPGFFTLVLAGFLVFILMVLPGVSGSLFLASTGLYPVVLNSLNTFSVEIFYFLAGICISLVAFKSGMKKLFEENQVTLNNFFNGLILGSLSFLVMQTSLHYLSLLIFMILYLIKKKSFIEYFSNK